MPEITRRRFLRNASIGAAAAGAVAVGGTSLFSAVSAGAAAPPLLSSVDTPTIAGSGIVAHVDDAKTGQISIFVGDRTISYVDVGLAQQLMRAAR